MWTRNWITMSRLSASLNETLRLQELDFTIPPCADIVRVEALKELRQLIEVNNILTLPKSL